MAFLYATEVAGMDAKESAAAATMFCNQFRSYERLSPGLQEDLRKTRAVHSAGGILAANAFAGAADGKEGREKAGVAGDKGELGIAVEQVHPCLRVHPETGRTMLYLFLACG